MRWVDGVQIKLDFRWFGIESNACDCSVDNIKPPTKSELLVCVSVAAVSV